MSLKMVDLDQFPGQEQVKKKKKKKYAIRMRSDLFTVNKQNASSAIYCGH